MVCWICLKQLVTHNLRGRKKIQKDFLELLSVERVEVFNFKENH